MKRKILPWLLFVGFSLVMAASSTGLVRFADSVLWPVRLGLLLGLSGLLIWAKWRGQGSKPGWADECLSSVVRWYHGDTKR